MTSQENPDCVCPRNWDPVCFKGPDGVWREYGNFCGLKCAWQDSGLFTEPFTRADALAKFAGSLHEGECSEHVPEGMLDSDVMAVLAAEEGAPAALDADHTADDILASDASEASFEQFDL
eukprot:tig00020704_g13180.t1